MEKWNILGIKTENYFCRTVFLQPSGENFWDMDCKRIYTQKEVNALSFQLKSHF